MSKDAPLLDSLGVPQHNKPDGTHCARLSYVVHRVDVGVQLLAGVTDSHSYTENYGTRTAPNSSSSLQLGLEKETHRDKLHRLLTAFPFLPGASFTTNCVHLGKSIARNVQSACLLRLLHRSTNLLHRTLYIKLCQLARCSSIHSAVLNHCSKSGCILVGKFRMKASCSNLVSTREKMNK